MRSSDNPELSTGYWYNRDGGLFCSLQWTTTQYWSDVVGLCLLIPLAWASPWIMKIVRRLLLWLAFASGISWTRGGTARREGEHENDNASSEKSTVSYWLAFTITGLSVLSFACLSAMFDVNSPACNAGLVESKNCGMWVLDKGIADHNQYEQDIEYQVAKERRAAEYARLCYRGTSVANPEACSVFVEQRIPNDVYADDCPFSEGLCAGGALGAITFDTGLVPARKLGLNIKQNPMIHRKTTCAPLKWAHYVEEEGPGPGHPNDYQYRFKYGNITHLNKDGSKSHQNYTFLMPGDPFRWDVGTYSVWIYEFAQHESDHFWTPLPELMPPENTFLTLMFIASCHILYRDTWPTDYIFPRPEFDRDYGLYVNPWPMPRPLACIDKIEICTKDDEASCSPIHPAGDSVNGPGHEFARLALKHSKIYDAIQYRMGTALLAQESIGQFRSRPLCGPNDDRCEYTQWILEARALFETSLARMQFDALDIAMGLHSSEGKLYHDDTAHYWRGDKLCEIFKIQLPKDYGNINLAIIIVYLIFLPSLWWLRRDSGQGYAELEENQYFGSNMINLEWVCFRLVRFFSTYGRELSHRISGASSGTPNGSTDEHEPLISHHSSASSVLLTESPSNTGVAQNLPSVSNRNTTSRQSSPDSRDPEVFPNQGSDPTAGHSAEASSDQWLELQGDPVPEPSSNQAPELPGNPAHETSPDHYHGPSLPSTHDNRQQAVSSGWHVSSASARSAYYDADSRVNNSSP